MKRLKLAGLIAAPFTPFDERGEVNYAMIEKQATSLIADGVKGAYVCGTIGESRTTASTSSITSWTTRSTRGRSATTS